VSTERPAAVAGTSRVLLVGTLLSALGFAVGLGLTFVGSAALAASASNVGVLVLLATPVLGLVVSAIELRRAQPQAALMAIAVLAVLGVAVLVALVAH
jgi:hypothetical protein